MCLLRDNNKRASQNTEQWKIVRVNEKWFHLLAPIASTLFTENNVNSPLLFSFSYFIVFHAFYFVDSCFDVWQLQPQTNGRSAVRGRRLPRCLRTSVVTTLRNQRHNTVLQIFWQQHQQNKHCQVNTARILTADVRRADVPNIETDIIILTLPSFCHFLLDSLLCSHFCVVLILAAFDSIRL